MLQKDVSLWVSETIASTDKFEASERDGSGFVDTSEEYPERRSVDHSANQKKRSSTSSIGSQFNYRHATSTSDIEQFFESGSNDAMKEKSHEGHSLLGSPPRELFFDRLKLDPSTPQKEQMTNLTTVKNVRRMVNLFPVHLLGSPPRNLSGIVGGLSHPSEGDVSEIQEEITAFDEEFSILGSPPQRLVLSDQFSDMISSSKFSMEDVLGSPPRALEPKFQADTAFEHGNRSMSPQSLSPKSIKRKASRFSREVRPGKKRIRRYSNSSTSDAAESGSSFHLDGFETKSIFNEESAKNDPTIPSTGLYSKARILGDPWFWENAWQKLKELTPSAPVDIQLLDFYCLGLWSEAREKLDGCLPPCYYLDIRTVRNLRRGCRESLMKAHLSIFQGSSCPYKPVFLFLEGLPEHVSPMLLFLDYQQQSILILCSLANNVRYEGAPWLQETWGAIAQFFEWGDRGFSAVTIIQKPWVQGIAEFGQKSASLLQSILEGKWAWEGVHNGLRPPNFHCLRLIGQQIFVKTLERCHSVAQMWSVLSQEPGNAWKLLNPSTTYDLQTGFLNFSWVKYSLIRFSNFLRACIRCETHSSVASSCVLADFETDDDSPASEDLSVYQGIRVPRQEKRKQSPILNEPGLTEPPLPFSEDDDDYKSAPMARRDAVTADKDIWIFGNDGVQVLPDCWSFWKDQGYRLHSTFFRTLPLDAPSTGSELKLFSEQAPHSELRPLASMEEGCLSFSAQEFIDEAGPQVGTKHSKRVFLRGKEREPGTEYNPSKFLVLDLEKDAVKVAPENINISVDIDSLVWVTSANQFVVNSLDLLTAPFGERRSQFSINNFVSVNLVSPPLDEEELQNPATRSHENVRLSRIPNVEFGHCGEGDRRINFYIFFPRMVWKKHKTGRYQTAVPYAVEELWFDNVILPSCKRLFFAEPGFMEYVPSSLDEIRNRSGERKRHLPIVGSERTKELLGAMNRLISEDLTLLSCFGSFFIVADGRGMKLATKQCIQDTVTKRTLDFSLIQEEFSQLNWMKMQDRRCGELYLDVGISYHPQTEEPLIGLWRLNNICESSGVLGLKKGTTHHMSTLGLYGGLKAEMQLEKKRQLHLVSRLSYCLVFELVRNPGKAYLCGDEDNIKRTDKFISACKKWQDLFHSGMTKSFGVRDEIRGLAGAILQLLPNASDKAKEGIKSDAILWMKSSTFFTFLNRRFSELLLLHKSYFDARLPNYRTMSLIIGHLLRYSLVTPILKNSEISESFRELRFREVMMGWGMFFLHNLNLKTLRLEGVPDEDSKPLQDAYKAPFKLRPAKDLGVSKLKVVPGLAKKQFPFGESVSVLRLEGLVNECPEQILRDHDRIEADSLKHEDSGLLFRMFTSQIWFLLGKDFHTSQPEFPKDLESAMDFWTVGNLQLLCAQMRVLPTYDGLVLEGFKAGKEQLFAKRKSIFFPPEEEARNSPLAPYAQNETLYLWSYHQILKSQTAEQIQHIESDLDMIFSHLQCLPATTRERGRDTIWKTDGQNLLFIVNAVFCRLKAVTAIKPEKKARAQLSAPALKKRIHESIYGHDTYRKHHRQKLNRTKPKKGVASKRAPGPRNRVRVALSSRNLSYSSSNSACSNETAVSSHHLSGLSD